jgi:hypothetical protein
VGEHRGGDRGDEIEATVCAGHMVLGSLYDIWAEPGNSPYLSCLCAGDQGTPGPAFAKRGTLLYRYSCIGLGPRLGPRYIRRVVVGRKA